MSNGDDNRFCFVAIVRDESPVIERCMRSIADIATSYLICDTGSVDDTVEKIRRFMAERSIAYIVGFLTVAGTLLGLPIVGMYYGLHEWTAAHTGGLVDARTIALIDTALESPLGQIAMIPMLAWIANSAPANLKATYFAVMASFSNLALSASQLGTRYLNEIYVVAREVRDRSSGAIRVPQDYSELGALMIATALVGLLLPLVAVAAVRGLRLRTA